MSIRPTFLFAGFLLVQALAWLVASQFVSSKDMGACIQAGLISLVCAPVMGVLEYLGARRGQ